MPYVKQQVRAELEFRPPQNPGELNFILSRHISGYIGRVGVSYQTLHDAVGVLRDIASEIESRFTSLYEQRKKVENGEVFQEIVDALEAKREA